MNKDISYGEYIKKRRKELGLSQKDVAKVLLCSYQAISKYENNINNLDISLLAKLTKLFNVDLTSLLKKEVKENNDYHKKYEFNKDKFIYTLRYFREKNLISSKDVAKRLNISTSKYSKIETGVMSPSILEFMEIAKLFNCSYEELYFGIDLKLENKLINDNNKLINIEEENNINNINNSSSKNKLLLYFKKIRNNKSFKIAFSSFSIFIILLVLSLAISLPIINANNYINSINDNNSNGVLKCNNIEELNKYYEYKEDNKGIVLTSFKGNNKKIEVPGKIGEKIVYKIASSCFNTEDLLTDVIINEGIEEIEEEAFNRCYALNSVSLPSSLKKLENNAFSIAYSLKSISLNKDNQHFTIEDNILYSKDYKELYRVLPKSNFNNGELKVKEGVETIKGGAFDSTYYLTSIYFPSTLKKIESLAFIDSYTLKNVYFNEGLETIECDAFFNCGFKTIYLPSSLKELTGNPFVNCLFLEEVNIPSSNNYFLSNKENNYSIFSKDLSKLYYVSSSINFNISNNILFLPISLKEIASFAISYNSSLSYIFLSSNISYMDKYSIYNNSYLNGVIVDENTKGLNKEAISYNAECNIYLSSLTYPKNSSKDCFFGNSGNIYYKDEWKLNSDNIPILI